MDYHQITQDTYNQVAIQWDASRQYCWAPVEMFLLDIDNKEDKLLLDAGCGNGRHMILANKLGFQKEHMLGIDYAQQQVDICQSKGFHAQVQDLTSLSLSRIYDHILCIATLHHLCNPEEQLLALKNLHKCLAQRGSLLLSIWLPSSEYVDQQQEKSKVAFVTENIAKVTFSADKQKFDRYYYFFEAEEIKKLCQQAGFAVTSETIDNGNLFLELTKSSRSD